jgi:hypothetical protein
VSLYRANPYASQQVSLVYGLPSAQRPQRPYRMTALVAPQNINVRSEPGQDAPISGTASGMVWMLGRDTSGKYVYLPDYHGWVLADATYLTLPKGFTVDQLVVLDPAAIPTQG